MNTAFSGSSFQVSDTSFPSTVSECSSMRARDTSKCLPPTLNLTVPSAMVVKSVIVKVRAKRKWNDWSWGLEQENILDEIFIWWYVCTYDTSYVHEELLIIMAWAIWTNMTDNNDNITSNRNKYTMQSRNASIDRWQHSLLPNIRRNKHLPLWSQLFC